MKLQGDIATPLLAFVMLRSYWCIIEGLGWSAKVCTIPAILLACSVHVQQDLLQRSRRLQLLVFLQALAASVSYP